jgi:hypothetical protein
LKAEIERIQNLLEQSRERMQKDFESWLSVMIRQMAATNQMMSSTGGGGASLSKGGGTVDSQFMHSKLESE